MRKCENCSKLKGKYCAAGFSPIICKWTGAILRPSRCKKKYKTTKRQYALTWKKALAKLDDEFQMYIRWRDGWTCKTCGKSVDPNNHNANATIHAGHTYDNYTAGVSNTQRYKMIGNGWTVDIIAHIFSFIKE